MQKPRTTKPQVSPIGTAVRVVSEGIWKGHTGEILAQESGLVTLGNVCSPFGTRIFDNLTFWHESIRPLSEELEPSRRQELVEKFRREATTYNLLARAYLVEGDRLYAEELERVSQDFTAHADRLFYGLGAAEA